MLYVLVVGRVLRALCVLLENRLRKRAPLLMLQERLQVQRRVQTRGAHNPVERAFCPADVTFWCTS